VMSHRSAGWRLGSSRPGHRRPHAPRASAARCLAAEALLQCTSLARPPGAVAPVSPHNPSGRQFAAGPRAAPGLPRCLAILHLSPSFVLLLATRISPAILASIIACPYAAGHHHALFGPRPRTGKADQPLRSLSRL